MWIFQDTKIGLIRGGKEGGLEKEWRSYLEFLQLMFWVKCISFSKKWCDLYYLRLLVHHIKESVSFKLLRHIMDTSFHYWRISAERENYCKLMIIGNKVWKTQKEESQSNDRFVCHLANKHWNQQTTAIVKPVQEGNVWTFPSKSREELSMILVRSMGDNVNRFFSISWEIWKSTWGI